MRMLINQGIYSFSFGKILTKEVIFIHFENKMEYRVFLKQNIPSARWSPQNKAWFVADTSAFRKLFHLPAKLYLGKEALRNIHPNNQTQFTDFINHLRLNAYSESTIKTYAIELAQWFYALDAVFAFQVTPEDIKSYLLYCINELHLSENQIHSRLNALKYYYEKVLHQEKFFFEIPRPKKKSTLPKVFSQKEIILLFEVTINPKHRMMLKLGYGLGLRVSEIAQLKVTSIDSSRMMVHIENAKGKKDRYVPLPESILLELRAYYIQYKPKVYLFEHNANDPISTRTIQAVFKNAMNKAQINKKVGIHGLRHSYATHLLEQGTDMSFIQKLLGHNHVKTTEVYAKVTNTFLSKVVSPLDTLYLPHSKKH